MGGYETTLRDRAHLLANTVGITVLARGREGDVALVELCALHPTTAEVEAAKGVIQDEHRATLADHGDRAGREPVDRDSITFWERQTRQSATRRDRMLDVLTRYEAVVGHWERYGHL
jgi:hypothetical protein